MNTKKTTLGIIVSLIGLSASMSAVASDGPELKIGISQEFEAIHPHISTTVAAAYIYGFVNRPLVALNTKGKWVPQLAKSIPSVKDGTAKIETVAGKKVLTAIWEIKDNAKWGDGNPVVCEDFAFSKEVASADTVTVASRDTFTMVAKIESIGGNPKKCLFTYDSVRWDFANIGKFYPLPKHLEKPIFDKFGKVNEAYEKNSLFSKAPTTAGLFNGPYLITDIKLGSHIVLEKNPHFFGAAPQISKVVIKLIPNTGTLEANLRSGTIDKIASLGLTFDQALAFEKKIKSEQLPLKMVFKSSLTYEHIDLNLDYGPLKDVKVRRALVHSINREELVKALFENKQKVAHHLFAEIDPWYTTDKKYVQYYPFSKREAARLFDEAGWVLNEKDGLRYKGKEKLSITLMTTAGNKIRETVQTYLQNQWKAVGVEILIKNEPARVFFGETLKQRSYKGMGMYAWVSTPESSPRAQFHSSQIPTAANNYSGQNMTGWKSSKVDELIPKIEAEFDSNKRAELGWQFVKLYTEDVPVIPLYYRSDVAVIPTGLKNFDLSGHEFSETNEAETWRFEK